MQVVNSGARVQIPPSPLAVVRSQKNLKKVVDKAVIIGVGLIGSSLARVLKANGLAGKISGVARSSENRQTALDLGIADEMTDDAAEAVRDADIVFICTPVGAVGKVAEKIAPALKKGCIVTDVGSVKASVISAVQPFLPEDVFFVPAHPVAGTEKSGPQNGFAELFDGRWCILTPVSSSNEESVSLVRKVWETAGMKVEEMTPSISRSRIFVSGRTLESFSKNPKRFSPIEVW